MFGLDYLFYSLGVSLCAFIWKALYGIYTALASLVDIMQVLFRVLSGLEPISTSGNANLGDTGNLVEDILFNDIVKDLVFKLVILSALLLILFTFVAIIKNEYSLATGSKPDKTKGQIVGASIKGLVSFLVIPLVCFFGIVATSYLVKAIDMATASNSVLISNQVFITAATDANRARTDEKFYKAMLGEHVADYQVSNNFGIFNDDQFDRNDTSEGMELMADAIDSYFINASAIPSGYIVNTSSDKFGSSPGRYDSNVVATSMGSATIFDIKNVDVVIYYYDLSKFNYIIAYLSIGFLLVVFFNIVLSVTKRLFELVILFIIAPPIIAMMPLDNGSALNKWKGNFISKVTMIFAPVVAMNLYFIVVNLIMSINFESIFSTSIAGATMVTSSLLDINLSPTLTGMVQNIMVILVIIAGSIVVKESVGWLGQLIGSENMDESGGKFGKAIAGNRLVGKATGLVSKGAKATGTFAGKTALKGGKKLADVTGATKLAKTAGEKAKAVGAKIKSIPSNIVKRVSNPGQYKIEKLQKNAAGLRAEKSTLGTEAFRKDVRDLAKNSDPNDTKFKADVDKKMAELSKLSPNMSEAKKDAERQKYISRKQKELASKFNAKWKKKGMSVKKIQIGIKNEQKNTDRATEINLKLAENKAAQEKVAVKMTQSSLKKIAKSEDKHTHTTSKSIDKINKESAKKQSKEKEKADKEQRDAFSMSSKEMAKKVQKKSTKK